MLHFAQETAQKRRFTRAIWPNDDSGASWRNISCNMPQNSFAAADNAQIFKFNAGGFDIICQNIPQEFHCSCS